VTARGDGTNRCGWSTSNPLMVAYHDREWGVPLHNDGKLFELLALEAMQAGLSWNVVLQKRDNFRGAFHAFDPERVARYTERDIRRLLDDAGIIRNRLKIAATIANARLFLETREASRTFDRYIWQFVGGKPLVNRFRRLSQVPARTKESDAMSHDLRQRGFKFVGSTICYAFMQSAGMVNDLLVDCFRHRECQRRPAR
jgi:DNA-3-methyladenine glycosylase I